MTDRELVIELCWRLGLDRRQNLGADGVTLPDELGFTESPDDPLTILMGCGDDGQPGYYHAFVFDDAGKLTDHYIAE